MLLLSCERFAQCASSYSDLHTVASGAGVTASSRRLDQDLGSRPGFKQGLDIFRVASLPGRSLGPITYN